MFQHGRPYQPVMGRIIYVFECFCIAIPTSNGQLAVDVEPRTVQLALVAPSRATWRMMVKAQVGSAGLQPNHDRDFAAGGWDSRIPNHCGPKNIRYIRMLVIVSIYYICSHTHTRIYIYIIYIYIYIYSYIHIHIIYTYLIIFICVYYSYLHVCVCVRACIGSARPGMPAQKTCL